MQAARASNFSYPNALASSLTTSVPIRRQEIGSRGANRIALIGNSLPRRCGLATFTTDCLHALTRRYPGLSVDLYAIDDGAGNIVYSDDVSMVVRQEELADYVAAAVCIERSRTDVVWLQHEYGVFGGPAGLHLLELLRGVSAPLVVTLHTVLEDPNDEQRQVMKALVGRAATLVVMADRGRDLLRRVYGALEDRVAVVPHGVPDRPFERAVTRRPADLERKKVVMTFGLLSPSKGVEYMIDALPKIVAREPELAYLIVGATHPHLVAREGEAYRMALKERARALGVERHIRWLDAFLETDALLDLLASADVYVTPYLNPAQVTSGTLAYAVGLGRAVVSTPYVHAKELLGGGCGRLVPFRDARALAREIGGLLADTQVRQALEAKAYCLGRTMIWPRFAEVMMRILQDAVNGDRPIRLTTG